MKRIERRRAYIAQARKEFEFYNLHTIWEVLEEEIVMVLFL